MRSTSFHPASLGLQRLIAPVVALLLLASPASVLLAHEGHAPLPTRGAQVDLKTGVITLSAEARTALGVKTADVTLHAGEEKLLAYVTLETPWKQHAFVTTRVPGRISRLYAKPGQIVTAGEPLADIESLELENLQLDLLNAQNALELSAKTLERVEPLAKRGVIAGRDVLEARSTHQQNQNAIEISRMKLLSLGVETETIDRILRNRDARTVRALTLTAPIRGTAMHADLAVGKVVNPSEHLFEIIDLSTVWARINVLEKDLNRIEVGQPVELTFAAYRSEVIPGKVTVKGLRLDPKTHLGTVWAELENPAGQSIRFLPGMHGQARIHVGSPEELPTIPAAALITQGAEHYVLVEQAATAKASEYRRQNVVVERRSNGEVQLRAGGVYPGDRVVVVGAHELSAYFVQGVLRLSEEARKSIGLRVEPVMPRVVEQVIELDGAVDLPPDRRALVSSQLTGSVRSIHVDRGQRVKAGEVLAEIESLELQTLQLDLLDAHLQMEMLAVTLEQLRSAEGAVAGRQLLEAENQHQTLTNRRESLLRKLRTIGLTEADVDQLLQNRKLMNALPVRAPISGVLVDFRVTLGQVVQAEEPVFEIHDFTQALVEGYVSERDLGRVQIGQQARVRLTSLPDVVVEGKVIRSGRMLGTDDRTLSVWIELDEAPPQPLLHNMLTKISVTVDQPQPTLAVPLSAVMRDGTQSYVFIQKSDGTFARQPVRTGRSDDRFVEIDRGLKAQQKIAVTGVPELRTAYAGVR